MTYVEKDWTLKERVEVDNFNQVINENMVEIYNRLNNVPLGDFEDRVQRTQTTSWQDIATVNIRSRGGILLVYAELRNRGSALDVAIKINQGADVQIGTQPRTNRQTALYYIVDANPAGLYIVKLRAKGTIVSNVYMAVREFNNRF